MKEDKKMTSGSESHGQNRAKKAKWPKGTETFKGKLQKTDPLAVPH